MTQTTEGYLSKMIATSSESGPVEYSLPLNDQLVPLNALLGRSIKLAYKASIRCRNCGRITNKSFNQGHCYPCFKKLASCDICMVSPEKCHFDQGTCREPEWANHHCMTDHIVYLANSSGVKVGITRGNQVPTRWIDQGATQALPIMRVATRYQSGLVEDVFRQHVADKTNWRVMLKGNAEPVDLAVIRDQLFEKCAEQLNILVERFGLQAIRPIEDAISMEITYPVLTFPEKVTSFNFDKSPVIEDKLVGIKGQYLIFDSGVLNIRKFTAYQVALTF